MKNGEKKEMENINKKFQEITEYFFPKVIAEVNDVYVKLAKIKGDKIPWHTHANEDELFYVIDGKLLLEVRGEENRVMTSGDVYVVKKGTEHRVSATDECRIMLIENKTTAHTGEVQTDITRSVEEQR